MDFTNFVQTAVLSRDDGVWLTIAAGLIGASLAIVRARRLRDEKARHRPRRASLYIEKQPQPKQFPSIRSCLEKLHQDLFVIDRKVSRYDEFYELTDFEKLVIALEDKRFLRHDGIDPIACLRELLKAALFRKHGGASTIDMQFVRTATGFKDRTLKRKLYEILLSIVIQFRYSKRAILRSYLRCAFFGSHLIGADKAASNIFGKYRGQLTLEEASQLAAMLVYPKPLKPPEIWAFKVARRAIYGQRRMIRLENFFKKIPR